MARLSYKGYTLNLRPLKTDNQWQLEFLKKSGGEINTHLHDEPSKNTFIN